MPRARSGKGNSRTLIAGYLATALLALAAAGPAAAENGGTANGGSSPNGGSGLRVRPVIVGLTCLQRCGASSASAGARPVAVRADGVLKIRGRNMSAVKTVIFTGRAGSRDDVRVSPSGVGRLSVDVRVPARATSGRVVLLASPLTYSSPSPGPVMVLPKDEPSKDPAPAKAPPTGPPSSAGLVWPVPRAPIYGVFGENRGTHFHSGIDISSPVGTPIQAAAAGRVLFSGPQGAYGNFICIAHSTVSTCYAHLSEMLAMVGTSVGRGQVIGKVGMTGNSRGPHLHFEVRTGTRMWATAVDPMAYLPGGLTTARASAASDPLDWGLPVYGLGG